MAVCQTVSEDSQEAELPCSSRLVPLMDDPFGDAMQGKLPENMELGSKQLLANSADDPPMPHTARPSSLSEMGNSGYRERSQSGSVPSTPDQLQRGTSSPSPFAANGIAAMVGSGERPAKLPPLKHMLLAQGSLDGTDMGRLPPPTQRARPASASQLDARLAYAQQHGAAPAAQPQPGSVSADTAAAHTAPISDRDPAHAKRPSRQGSADPATPPAAAVARPRAPSASPAGLNVRELMEAAQAARQLEAEVHRLEAERRALQAQLAAEAAERQRCGGALEQVHAAGDR